MIHASISIRVKGQIYKYVRDVTTDTAGVGSQYYAYRGNARRKLNMTPTNSILIKDTKLKPKTNYTFKTNVNTAGLVEHTVSFSDYGRPISMNDVFNKLNVVSDTFDFIWNDSVREDEGFYFVANGRQANTSILVSPGDTNDLFANLEGFISIGNEIASDNFFDQDQEAGQILHDLEMLTTQLSDENINDNAFLQFPESGGNTEMLIRESHEIKGHLVISQANRKSIDGFNVIEINKANIREGHIG